MRIIKNFFDNIRVTEDTLKEFNQPAFSQKEKFNNILDFAKSVLRYYDNNRENSFKTNSSIRHPLIDVVNILGKNIQTKYLTNLLYQKKNSQFPSINQVNFFFKGNKVITPLNENNFKTFNNIKIALNIDKNIYLGRDLILPWPWERDKLISNIANIGVGRSDGIWKQDKDNHSVELWLPLGIAWVSGGNHSIMTGIIQCSGVIKPNDIYDISNVYKYVYCDGENYYNKVDNEIISPVKDIDFAAIFEIGRLMRDNSISF